MVDTHVQSLAQFIDRSPTPFHVVQTVTDQLTRASFLNVTSTAHELPDQGFMCVDGSLIAWKIGTRDGALRIIGAHTDSPNLRIQQHPDISHSGWSQLGVEIYGGVLLNSWLDRDLGIAGRVVTSQGDTHLFSVPEALARIPQLAIHLDREISDRGLLLDRFAHITPVWGTRTPQFLEWLSSVTKQSDIAAFDAHLFDITSPQVIGVDQSLFASARLDNQVSCWAAITSLIESTDSPHTHLVVLNDHEEVGSESVTGAAGPLLSHVVELIELQLGWNRGVALDKRRRSWCLSADNAHAIHPNYTERHDPRHAPIPNAGPAVKVNGNQRYATSARGIAHIKSVATISNTPLQTFMSRNNVPCGSTIGPITSTQMGIDAIDIGIPQLSMHSARELCGVDDVSHLVSIMKNFLTV